MVIVVIICDVIDTFLCVYIFYSAIVVQIKDIQFSEISKVVMLDGVTTTGDKAGILTWLNLRTATNL